MPKPVLLALLALSLAPVVSTAHPRATHFQDCQTKTGKNASVVLPGRSDLILARSQQSWTRVRPGDEVAAFTLQGVCAGVIVWDGSSAVLTVWMDDPTTPQKDGYIPGDPLWVHVWDASSGDVFVGYWAKYNPVGNTSGTFKRDAVYVIMQLILVPPGVGSREADEIVDVVKPSEMGELEAASSGASLPDEVVLEPSYPNPFRTAARLRYGLPTAEAVRVDVFDSRGRRVAVLVDENQQPGWYEAILPADGLASGVYIVRLRVGPTETVQRVTLVR